MGTFAWIDYVIIIAYAAMIHIEALFVSLTKRGIRKESQEYYLASKSF